MRGRVNGTDWRDAAGLDVLRFPGFAAANGTPQLIMRFGGRIPFAPAAGHVAITGTVDYEVIYRFQNRYRTRLTAMTVELMNVPVALGMRVANPMRVLFRNHREE